MDEYTKKSDIKKAFLKGFTDGKKYPDFVNWIAKEAERIVRQFIGSALDKYATACRECAADHRQLAEWLTELKDLREENEQLKRILKVAISNIYKKCSCENSDCDICEYNRETCDYDDRFTWRHKASVSKLIGETNDEP